MEIQLRGALVAAAMKAGITREALKGKFEIIREFPFDSTRKNDECYCTRSRGEKVCRYEGSTRCPSANESNDFMGGISSNH